jgi:hypothetical protein
LTTQNNPAVRARKKIIIMKHSLREVLADSQVAAVAIAVFLLSGFDAAFRSLWEPFYRLGFILFTAVGIWDIPSHFSKLTSSDHLNLIATLYLLYSAIVCFAAAWGLSRWIYGEGPFRSLIVSSRRLLGRKYA